MSETAIRPRFEELTLAERAERYLPLALAPILALAALAVVGDTGAWLTLTVAGLAMGIMIFIMASGMTLVFGLMDVINFGHGAFITLGAFVGVTVLAWLGGWVESPSVMANLVAVSAAIIGAMTITAVLGYAFERGVVTPVYGDHLKQILVTTGGLIIAEQMVYVIWGPDAIHMSRPAALSGSYIVGDAIVEKYRLLVVVVGLVLFLLMRWILARTKIGLLVRAGVENPEIVQTLGYRIRRLFVMVFIAGSALAGLGGVMWGIDQQTITAHMGSEIMVLVFIVVIVGGLGSVGGCFIGAMLVGLLANYAGFLVPKLALVSNIALMMMVLMWRPQGLYPVVKAK